MFHKFNHHHFRNTVNNLKHHIQRGYHHVKHVAHQIDYGVHVAKDVYKIIEPLLKEYHPHHGHIHHHAVKALSGYENLRNQALEVNHHVNTISHKLSGLV